METKTCTGCHVCLHISYFGTRSRNGVTVHQSQCRACMRELWRRWKAGGGVRKETGWTVPDFCMGKDVPRVALVWRAA
jgi:hypothetical protein